MNPEPFATADGTLYQWYAPLGQAVCPNPGVETKWSLYRIGKDKSVREVLRLNKVTCLVCSQDFCTQMLNAQLQPAWYDLTSGLLYLISSREQYDCVLNLGCQPTSPPIYGLIVIAGFPTLFDVQLTFAPTQQTIQVTTPSMPDGFRSADSLQVWTGDVRSMPDWNQATPLTCEAATSPAPGQVVTFADTLPDPVVGSGRYYITASQSGPDRRLGRQFVNGTFSARDTVSLPACVTP